MTILFDARRVGGAENHSAPAELAGRDINVGIDGDRDGVGIGIGEGEGESRGQEEEGEAGHFLDSCGQVDELQKVGVFCRCFDGQARGLFNLSHKTTITTKLQKALC